MSASLIKLLFVVAGLYDGLLGAGFLLFGPKLFEVLNVTPPNHFGYVYFPALLLTQISQPCRFVAQSGLADARGVDS